MLLVRYKASDFNKLNCLQKELLLSLLVVLALLMSFLLIYNLFSVISPVFGGIEHSQMRFSTIPKLYPIVTNRLFVSPVCWLA